MTSFLQQMMLFNVIASLISPFIDGSGESIRRTLIMLDDPTQAPDGPISLTLGIVVAFVTSITQSLGLTMQRKSNILNEMKPEAQRTGGYRRLLWMSGFFIFIISNILGSVFQLASLPLIILAPLAAVPLVWNAFFARILLGDMFSPYMVSGTLAIACGAVLIGIFGVVPVPARSLEDLLRLFKREAFIVYFSLSCVGLGVCLLATHIVEFTSRHKLVAPTEAPSILRVEDHENDISTVTERTGLLPENLYKKGDQRRLSIKGLKLFLAASYSSASGIMAGMSLVISKCGVELVILTVQGDNQFWRWEAWVLVIGLFASYILQLWYQNKSLVFGDPILVCPLAFSFLNLSAILNVLVYYDQFGSLSAVYLGLVFLGVWILLGGVWAVSVTTGNRDAEVKIKGMLPVEGRVVEEPESNDNNQRESTRN